MAKKTAFVMLGVATLVQSYCAPGESCWPTAAEVFQLQQKLDPAAPRNLVWEGLPAPRIMAVPVGSENDQPLYGAGEKMEALYVRQDNGTICYVDDYVTPFCLQSTRNLPQPSSEPAFVVWPLTKEHAREAVAFAVEHRLCISVAGTGHDFLSRHSCKDSMFIRTSLLKNVEWLTDDETVKLGAGLVFSEVHKHAADRGKVIASGWASTVGVVGWHTGGGHGPFGTTHGLGVDNIVEVELVTPNAELVTANATHNADLFRGLRGGGGSIWGVITSLTVKAHAPPPQGYTQVVVS